HLVMVTLALDLHPLAQIAGANLAQDTDAFRHGQQRGVQQLVDPFEELAILALVLAGVGPYPQTPLDASPEQCFDVFLALRYHLDQAVSALFEGVVFALVFLANGPWNFALAQLVEHTSGHAQGLAQLLKGAVEALDDRAKLAKIPASLSAHVELAIHRRLRQHGR